MPRSLASMLPVLWLLVGADAEAVTFTDGDFSTGWVDSIVVVDDPRVGGPGPGTASGSIARIGSGGNPGAYRQAVHNANRGDNLYTVGVNTNDTYDPTIDGAIASIDFSIDLLEDPTIRGASGITLVLEQSGTLFYNQISSFSNASWATFSLDGVLAQDFETTPNNGIAGAILAGVHPDFSTMGAAINFGYALGNTIIGGSGTLTHRADNWSVTVNPVPEPSTALLVGLGLAGVSLARRGTSGGRRPTRR